MPMRSGTRTSVLAGMLILCCGPIASSSAAEPTIRSIDVRGMQLGAKTMLTIDGTDLAPNPRLLLPFAASQQLKEGATAARAVFEVQPDDAVTPGIYNLRVATDEGATAALIVGVDRLPQRTLAAEVAGLPIALHGTVGGSSVVETRFTGKAGEEITIDVESQRLGSKLRPVVHLLNAARVQLAWAWPTPSLFGDARLSLKVPVDGVYLVQLHDAEYAAPAPGYFRLKIGTWQAAGQVFPPAITRGQTAAVELLGGASPGRVDVVPPLDASWAPLAWFDPALASGLRPRVLVSDIPEIVEPAEGIAELPACPVAFSGRLAKPGEEDRLRLSVTPGTKLRMEVFAERYGSPMDSVLLVRNEQGQQLARGEDGPGTVDSLLEYTVPEKVESLQLAIRDLHGRGGPRCIYRIAIDTASASHDAGFDLRAATDRLRVSRSGRCVVPLFVERRGYSGPIRLALDHLPAAVTLASAEVPEQMEGVLLSLEAGEGGLEQMLTVLRGVSPDGKFTRLANTADHPLASIQPWLAHELAVAASPPTGYSADWGELPSDASLPRGLRLTLPIRVARPEGQAGPVRLTLLTSHDPPKANGRPDPNRSLRAEAAVELAADKSEGELKVVIPVDLSSKAYDLALQAELLSADKQKVLMTAYTPVRRSGVINPLLLELAGPRFEATLDAKTGATVKLAGKIERKADLKGDVTITASGLPAGIRAAPLVVKADAVDFELPLMFPANTKPGDVTGIKLSASVVPDSRLPQAILRTSEQEVLVAIVAPPAEAPPAK